MGLRDIAYTAFSLSLCQTKSPKHFRSGIPYRCLRTVLRSAVIKKIRLRAQLLALAIAHRTKRKGQFTYGTTRQDRNQRAFTSTDSLVFELNNNQSVF